MEGKLLSAQAPEREVARVLRPTIGHGRGQLHFLSHAQRQNRRRLECGDAGGFTFVLKAPQRITHFARLQNIDDPLRFFLETIRKLNAKLGAVLFQLPPNFKKDIARLSDLLTQFPSDVRAACEFRHASWWSDDVYELLRSTNTALCIADTEEGTTPLVATADFGYLRLRDEGYAEDSLRDWTQKVQAWGDAWTDAYIFFKHEEKGMGPKLARQFLTLAVDTPRPPTPESDKRSGPEK